jgi:prophage regulatory protein
MRDVKARSGLSRTLHYRHVKQGLMPKPVKLSDRAVGWPASEIEAINAARIAGKSDEEIRALVKRLEAARVAA